MTKNIIDFLTVKINNLKILIFLLMSIILVNCILVKDLYAKEWMNFPEYTKFVTKECKAGKKLKSKNLAITPEIKSILSGTSNGYAYCQSFGMTFATIYKSAVGQSIGDPRDVTTIIKKSHAMPSLLICDNNNKEEVAMNIDAGSARAFVCAMEVSQLITNGKYDENNNCAVNIMADCNSINQEFEIINDIVLEKYLK